MNTLNNTKKISDIVGERKSFFLLRKKNTLQKDQLIHDSYSILLDGEVSIRTRI